MHSLTDQTRRCPSDTAAAHTTQVDWAWSTAKRQKQNWERERESNEQLHLYSAYKKNQSN